MEYVKHHDQNVLMPALTHLAKELESIGRNQHAISVYFNNLADFLQQVGLKQSADGRFHLNQHEFQAFCIKRKNVPQPQNSPPDA